VRKKTEEEKERWQYVEYRWKIFFLFRAMRNRRKEKKRRRKKECECTSDPSPGQSVSNDDAMLMNSSIVDDNFLCVPLSLLHYRQRPASSSLPLLFAFL
jgi:hypothetical protein